MTLDPRAYVDQWGAGPIGAPQRQLTLGVGGHEDTHRLIVGPDHRRNARQLGWRRHIEARSHVYREHHLDIQLCCRLERDHPAEAPITVAATAEDNRRVIQRQRAAGAEYIHERRNLRPRTEEHQLTGIEIYRQRLPYVGSGYSASPVAADGKIYLSSEDGEMLIVTAGREFKHLATNAMGELLMATPALSNGVMFVRATDHLFAIGRKP